MSAQLPHFITGNAYFIVTFGDENLTVPIVQTLIFEEQQKRTDGTAYFLFKELRAMEEDSRIFLDEEDASALVLDRKGLIARLKKCFSGQLPYTPPD